MATRFQARRSNGRWERNTLSNTFGLRDGMHGRKADGSWCGGLNPSGLHEAAPTTCGHCGEALTPDATASEENQP